jgi:hypothetical protein
MCAKQFAAVTSWRPVLAFDLARHLGAEITLDGGDAAFISNVADIGRFDAKHAVAGVLKIRQQRAIVGADIDHHIVFAQAQHGGGFTLQISEIISQQLSCPTGIRIFRRENNDGSTTAELYQVTLAAVQSSVGNHGCWRGTCPIGTIWLTGGM